MNKKTLKMDLILILAFVLVGALIGLVCLFSNQDPDLVEVKVDGEVVAEYPLNEDATYTIQGTEGTNKLVISGGYAQITEASCPDKLCVNMGKISRQGQSIVCLPNKVVVSIVEAVNDSSEVDVISR